ncbi:MAG: hypothetical protein LC539_16305, partial [Candidatus Thiodiazotropha sp.]|nr:hypothetical protein [Candidatus Thiodiazotropha sp.]
MRGNINDQKKRLEKSPFYQRMIQKAPKKRLEKSPFYQRMIRNDPINPVKQRTQETTPPVVNERDKYESNVWDKFGPGATHDLEAGSATLGDILTGVAEIPYTAAQMGLAGVEALSPAGSGMESKTQSWRKNVNDWSASVGPFYDKIFGGGNTYGREIGQMIGTAPLGGLKALDPALKGWAGFRGAAGLGATSNMLSQPTSEEDAGEFLSKKLGQAVTGAGFGAAAKGLEPLVGRALKPFSTKADPVTQGGMDAADRLGVHLTPAQKIGSPGLE